MIGRSLIALSLVLVAAVPLAAQMNHDADKKVHGGKLPAGWAARADGTGKVGDASISLKGGTYHVMTGPAVILWSEKGKVNGPFTASATFTQMKAPTHPEAYGVFFQGTKLNAADVSYFYFLVRGDGKFMLNHRAGEAVHKLQEWTDNAAVAKQDAKGGAKNTLTVDAAKGDSVRLLVNGKQVHAIAASNLASGGGNVGLRVNHNLDVEVSDLTIAPAKKK